jgi:hypothetical protein
MIKSPTGTCRPNLPAARGDHPERDIVIHPHYFPVFLSAVGALHLALR